MILYEIKTFGARSRPSLVMFAHCESDLEAILLARDYIRGDQSVEVWRNDRLLYRKGMVTPIEDKPAGKGWAGGFLRRFFLTNR